MGGSWRMCILVLLFSEFVISVNGKKSASPGCRVRQFGKRLDCRGAGLKRIPRMNKGILIADFTDNLITHLAKEDLEHLRKLQKVYLNGNPLHCDCNLEWLRLGRKSLPVIQDVDSIQCKTPYHLRNKPLNSLSDLCSNGRIMHDRKNSLPDDEKNDIAENEDDSNKCSNNDDCPSGKVCTNNKCQCKDGYHAEEGGCEDVDECQRGSHMCSELTTICKNTVGSYTCKCSEGYKMGDKECIDKNECENPDVCGKGPKCVNTLGSYQCKCVGDKEVGYEYVADMKQCMDVNECAQQLCDKNSTICKNSIGSYKCGCKPGYSNMKKNKCKDIDECSDAEKCKGQGDCFNTPGSYFCRCRAGFILDESDFDSDDKCKDEDECKTRKHNCEKQSYCRNTPGSFKCECPKGFEKDGHKCRATRLTRWLTPKYLLRDIKQGVWDTLAVAGSACVIVLALLIIFMVKLRKCCKKCCKKPGYEDQFYYPDEMYDPDQMFFAESEPMFYPEEMAYHGEEMMYPEKGMYPEGYSEDGMYCEGYPEDEYYPEGVEDANHGLDMTDKSIFNLNVKRSENVPVTYYDNDNEDLSDEYD